jgi:nucleotide-binding universal stress UspA family protein
VRPRAARSTASSARAGRARAPVAGDRFAPGFARVNVRGTARAIERAVIKPNEEPVMDKILVAVDFTDASTAAVEQAMALASKLGAELEIVHVAAPPPPMPAEIIAREPLGPQIDEAKHALARMVAAAKGRGLTARSHLLAGEIVFGVLDAIEQYDVTFAVVGSHGKGAIRRALIGSVAERVVRHAKVPVLVVPPPQRVAGAKTAWSCEDCGHILADVETTERCAGCGALPAHWLAAPITSGPIDAGEPAVGEVDHESIAPERANDSAGLFATSPPGCEGYSVNPELRVRY